MLQRNAGDVTRRTFLRGAGATVAGLAAIGSAGLMWKNTAIATQGVPASDKLGATAWPYVKLKTDAVADRTFQKYFKGG